MKTGRPLMVWISAAMAAVLGIWTANYMGPLVRAGDYSVMTFVTVFIPLTFAVVGFWLLRWWGLIAAAVCAMAVALSPLPSELRLFVPLALSLTALLTTSLAFRKDFKW
jgi:hypothetical protein